MSEIPASGSAAPAQTSPAEMTVDDIHRLDHAQIEARLPDQHPVACYFYAKRLLQEGSRDRAVFWGYVGQLRYRFYLQILPKESNAQALAYFASLQEGIGLTLNRAIGTDPQRWWEILGEVLTWDRSHHNGHTSKTAHPDAWAHTVSGLESFRAQLQRDAASVAARFRAASGG